MLKIVVHGFHENQFNHFVGIMLTMADALGLESSQREAYKSMLKKEIWELWEHPKFIEEKESIIPDVPQKLE